MRLRLELLHVGIRQERAGTTKTVGVTITSSDGRTITGFALSSAGGAVLPAGWSSPDSFGCQTLTTGSMTLNFQATTNDNVLAALAPSGQINATVNSGSQTVTATFATDDGNPAAGLAVTSAASALPPGWSAPTFSSCATVSAGSACQLSWVYAPTAPGNGTITIDYSFNDDSGNPKTSSFNIPYAATANDNVVATVSPSSVSTTSGSPAAVTSTFTTDDGFVATNLSMDLSSLPSGWTAASNPFTCASISTGTACKLGLTYTPQSSGDHSCIPKSYICCGVKRTLRPCDSLQLHSLSARGSRLINAWTASRTGFPACMIS